MNERMTLEIGQKKKEEVDEEWKWFREIKTMTR